MAYYTYSYTDSPYSLESSDSDEQICTERRTHTGETIIRMGGGIKLFGQKNKEKEKGSSKSTPGSSTGSYTYTSGSSYTSPPPKNQQTKPDNSKSPLITKSDDQTKKKSTPTVKSKRSVKTVRLADSDSKSTEHRCRCATHALKVCLKKSLSGTNIHMAEIDWPDFETDGLIVIWRRDEELIALPVCGGRVGLGVHELRDRGTSILQQKGFQRKDCATLKDLLKSKFTSMVLKKHTDKADKKPNHKNGENKTKHNNNSIEDNSESEEVDTKITNLITKALNKKRGEKTPRSQARNSKRRSKRPNTPNQGKSISNERPQIHINTCGNNHEETNPSNNEPTADQFSYSHQSAAAEHSQQVQTVQFVEKSLQVSSTQTTSSAVCCPKDKSFRPVNAQQMVLVNQTSSQTRTACVTGVAVATERDWRAAEKTVVSKTQEGDQLRSLLENVESDFCDSMYLDVESSDVSKQYPPLNRQLCQHKFLIDLVKSDVESNTESKSVSDMNRSELVSWNQDIE